MPRAGQVGRRGYAWWPRRRSVVLDVTLAVAASVEAGLTSYAVQANLGAFAYVIAGVAAACAASLVARRRFPATVALLACLATVAQGNITFLLVALYSLGAYSLRTWRMAVIGAATIVMQFGWILLAPNEQLVPAENPPPAVALWFILPSVVVATTVAPLLLGLYIGTRRRMIRGLRERAAQLEREQHLLADRVVAAERARIAREMHDVVAHRLTYLVVFSDALRSVAATDPAEAERAAKIIGDTSREALDELRQIIGVLRLAEGAGADQPAPQPSLTDVPELVAQSESAGIPVRLNVDGVQAKIPASVELAAYRLIQESLTNISKHAGQVDSEVSIQHHPDRLTVRITNATGVDATSPELPSGGHGIVGMRERVAMHDGVFTAGPRPNGGFEVLATFPLNSTYSQPSA